MGVGVQHVELALVLDAQDRSIPIIQGLNENTKALDKLTEHLSQTVAKSGTEEKKRGEAVGHTTKKLQDQEKATKGATRSGLDFTGMLKDARQSISGINPVLGAHLGQLENYAGALTGKVGPAILGVTLLVGGLLASMEPGGRVVGIQRSFEVLSGGAAQAEINIALLRKEVQGSASDLELMTRAALPVARGLSMEQLAKLSKEVRTQTALTGRSFQEVYGVIIDAILLKSVLRMDQFGVELDQTSATMMKTGELADEVITQLAEKNAKLGGSLETTATSMERNKSAGEDMKNSLAELGSEIAQSVGLKWFIDVWAGGVKNSAGFMHDAAKGLRDMRVAAKEFSEEKGVQEWAAFMAIFMQPSNPANAKLFQQGSLEDRYTDGGLGGQGAARNARRRADQKLLNEALGADTAFVVTPSGQVIDTASGKPVSGMSTEQLKRHGGVTEFLPGTEDVYQSYLEVRKQQKMLGTLRGSGGGKGKKGKDDDITPTLQGLAKTVNVFQDVFAKRREDLFESIGGLRTQELGSGVRINTSASYETARVLEQYEGMNDDEYFDAIGLNRPPAPPPFGFDELFPKSMSRAKIDEALTSRGIDPAAMTDREAKKMFKFKERSDSSQAGLEQAGWDALGAGLRGDRAGVGAAAGQAVGYGLMAIEQLSNVPEPVFQLIGMVAGLALQNQLKRRAPEEGKPLGVIILEDRSKPLGVVGGPRLTARLYAGINNATYGGHSANGDIGG